MPLKMKATVQEIYHSVAEWNGNSPRDGGRSHLLEAFEVIRREKLHGTMTVEFGLGGSIRGIEFIQRGVKQEVPEGYEYESELEDDSEPEPLN